VTRPHLLGLFHRHVSGDEALLELARRRFEKAGLGAEFYPATIDELERTWKLRPRSGTAHVAHLPRHWDLRVASDRRRIVEFADATRRRLYGLTIHDHAAWGSDAPAVRQAMVTLDEQLGRLGRPPFVFIEYAAGGDLGSFVQLFTETPDCQHVSACIDIGHVGIFNARRLFRQRHPEPDFWELRPDSPELPIVLDDLQNAVAAGVPAVLDLISTLGALGKPLHFHLHDGHPLSTESEYGVRDHLSFLRRIPIPFEREGRRSVPLLYGPDGLGRIVRAARASAAGNRLSFMLEIHYVPEREPLGGNADLFTHWNDLTNAERTNRWLSVLLENHELLRGLVRD